MTIADIAKMAGVAKSTVSRYLNNGSVSSKTKERLDRIIKETGFQPNTFAQSLKAKRTNLIGVVAPTLDSYATSTVLMAIDQELMNQGTTAIMINTSKQVNREIDSILNFARQKVDGIILIATELTKKHIDAIQSINVPVLIIGQEEKTIPSIIYDDYNAGFEIGAYIGECGHTNVSYLGVGEYDIAVGKVRKQGVIDGLRSKGVEQISIFESTFELQSARKVAKNILTENQPSAIICATDTLAIGTLRSIYEQNKQVPRDVSLTGFGGYDLSLLMSPSLTTIKYYHKKMGKCAATTILKLVNEETVEPLQKIGYDFIVNESVKRI